MTTVEALDDGRTIIGVEIRDEADYPFTVEISLKDVGGPSAGLMFALGIVDKLTPGSLTGGAFIAGTGHHRRLRPGRRHRRHRAEDDRRPAQGRHGVPVARRATAPRRATPVPDGLRLVRVTTLSDAVDALEDLRAGRADEVPTC